MTRNLKALGLALGAVFALSAMAASSASAIDTFTGPAGNVPITGLSHDNKFEITGSGTRVECTTAHFTSTVTSSSSNLTVNATYTGRINETPHDPQECTISGGSATVHMKTCDYDLTGKTTGSDLGTDAPVWITCTGTDEITITTSFGATLKIPGQTPTSGGVIYINQAGKIQVKDTVTGITYTCESAFLCGLAGIPTEGNNADYTGTLIASSPAGNISYSES
jgi:hypothetical protein